MSTHYTLAQPCRVEPLINNDELIRNGAPGGRNPNGTFAPGNRDSWKHGAYSRQTRRALVEDPEAASALADHCQEIETDLGGDASRLERDLVRRYVETAALADHLGRHLTHGGALTATGRVRAALSAYLRVLDRQHRLAAALGLKRRARAVEDVDHYLGARTHDTTTPDLPADDSRRSARLVFPSSQTCPSPKLDPSRRQALVSMVQPSNPRNRHNLSPIRSVHSSGNRCILGKTEMRPAPLVVLEVAL